jgi:hypothetical protein
MFNEHRHAVLSVLLALQGALILAGAVVLGLSASAIIPLDQIIGVDASIAGLVFGAALIMAFRHPGRTWVNLAILYQGLTIISQLWKYLTNYGTHLSISTMVVSAIFLILFAIFYPRAEVEVTATTRPATA